MLFKIFILIILILLNGLFASTEMAFVSLNKMELSEQIKKDERNNRLAKQFQK